MNRAAAEAVSLPGSHEEPLDGERVLGGQPMDAHAAMLAIAGSARYTAAEAAELAGTDTRLLLALRRAMGSAVPGADVRAYLDADVHALRAAAFARRSGTPEETLVELIRTLARGLKHSPAGMHALALRIALDPAVAEAELTHVCERAAGQLAPLVRPLVVNLLALQLSAAVAGARSEARPASSP